MLTDQEKGVLRQAICEGFLSGVQQGNDGRLNRRPVTPDLLASIALKSDDEIRATLLLYRSGKRDALNQQLAAVSTQNSKISSDLAALDVADAAASAASIASANKTVVQ